MATKDACFYCHITFALAEKRVPFEGPDNVVHDYHEDCDKKRARRTRLRELLIRHAIDNNLTVEPHGIRGR